MAPPVAGSYFDGKSSKRHGVKVTFNAELTALVLSADTLAGQVRLPLGQLRALSDHANRDSMTVTLHTEESGDESPRDTSRLILNDATLISQLKELCPDLNRRDLHKGTWPRIVKRTVFAVAAVVISVFVVLPRMADTLAELIPIKREIAFGKAVAGQIEWALGATELGGLQCSSPEGLAALDSLVARLSEGQSLQYDLEIKVFDHEMVNAFALPGGQIIIMRGLIDKASGPDAVAAVLAHEIGHVERRDATRHALRVAGSAGILSMALGDFSGGTIAVFLGEQMLQSSYTREAEADADIFALAMLNAASVNSNGMANFFDSLQEIEEGMPKIPGYFASHPASAERATQARKNAADQSTTHLALDDTQWLALKKICD